jgi:hypothetical protein
MKSRILIKDRQPSDEEMEVITDFVASNMREEIDSAVSMIAIAILREDVGLLKATVLSIMAASIHTWEISEEVDLSDQLFKFLGGQDAN